MGLGNKTTKELELAKQKAQEQHKKDLDDFRLAHGDHFKEYYLALPKVYRRTWFNSVAGISSKPAAIKAKCLDCSAYQKEEITYCKASTCPLYKFRPYQKKE